MKRTAVLSLLAIIGLAMATATPAVAATVHFESPEDCSEDLTFCVSQWGQSNAVATPSGNNIFTGEVTTRFTSTSSNGTFRTVEEYTDKFRYITKNDEPQVQRVTITVVTEQTGSSTCTYTARYLFANGVVRYDDSSFACK